MKHAARLTLTAAPQSLFDLLKQSDFGTDGVLLQRVSGTINYGNLSAQPFTLAASAAADGVFLRNTKSTKSLLLSGAAAVLNVGLF